MPGARYPIAMIHGVPVVAAPVEIDISNAGWLRVLLQQAACCGRRFVVDMTGTQFCASAGVGVLAEAHNRALAEGGELRLVMPADGASVRRVFAITGLDRVISHFPDLDQALEPEPVAAPRPSRKVPPKPRMCPHPDRPPDPAPGTSPA